MQSTICRACKFENAASVRFCIQCGLAMDAADARDETTPNASPELMLAETAAMLKRIAHESGYACEPTGAGIRVTVPLGPDRRQRVHVTFTGRDDDGHDIISFLSVCGAFDAKHAEKLMRLNAKLTYGAFAVRTIKGRDYFVVTANQLAGTADLEEIRKLLFEVARRADGIEEKLASGKDVY